MADLTDLACIAADHSHEVPDLPTGAHPVSRYLAAVFAALDQRRVDAGRTLTLTTVNCIELIEDCADVLDTLQLMIRFCWPGRVREATLQRARAGLNQLVRTLLAAHPYEPGPDAPFGQLEELLETVWGAAEDEAAPDADQLGEITAWLAAVTGAAACIACCVARSWPGHGIWPAAIATADAHLDLAVPAAPVGAAAPHQQPAPEREST